jgi:hypothetical protein
MVGTQKKFTPVRYLSGWLTKDNSIPIFMDEDGIPRYGKRDNSYASAVNYGKWILADDYEVYPPPVESVIGSTSMSMVQDTHLTDYSMDNVSCNRKVHSYSKKEHRDSKYAIEKRERAMRKAKKTRQSSKEFFWQKNAMCNDMEDDTILQSSPKSNTYDDDYFDNVIQNYDDGRDIGWWCEDM